MTQIDKAKKFHALHEQETPLVLFNIWDVATAKAVEAAGASALATGSWSLAAARGYEDGENIPLDRVMSIAERLSSQTALPVSLDFECGYSVPDDLDTLGANFERVIKSGVIGVNFEDQILDDDGLVPLKVQSQRIAKMREIATDHAVPMFINARTDIFLQADMGQAHARLVDGAIARGLAYAAAGASGFFVPGLSDEDLIAQICEALPLPVNVMAGPDKADTKRLSDLGVKRISYGPNPFRQLIDIFSKTARDIYKT